MMDYPGPVVSAHWLSKHLGDPALKIVDATLLLPDTGRNARNEYLEGHIPGAAFFDFDRVADLTNPLPRHFPDSRHFAAEIGALGISNDSHVIAYDSHGVYSAPRVWWLFRQYGYDHVSVVDGGIKAWCAAGLPLESGDAPVRRRTFVPGAPRGLIADWTDVLAAIQSDDIQILDARAPERYLGTDLDRDPGMRNGRIPKSHNLYWAHLLDEQRCCLLPPEQLRARFEAVRIDYDRSVILSCGSGFTACMLALGLHLTGMNDWRVYDGSWDEWGRRTDLPIETGASTLN